MADEKKQEQRAREIQGDLDRERILLTLRSEISFIGEQLKVFELAGGPVEVLGEYRSRYFWLTKTYRETMGSDWKT